MTPYAGNPLFNTNCGLAPKWSGRQSTMSASLPTSSEPISCDSPWAMAGLMVSLAMYWRTRSLSCAVGPWPHVLLVLRGELERAPHGLAGAPHSLRIAGRDADDPQVVQHALGAHRAVADAVLHHVMVAVRVVVQPVRGEDHLVVLVERVATERQRGVGAAADHVRHARQLQHVGHVPAAAAFDVERVDGAAVEHAAACPPR